MKGQLATCVIALNCVVSCKNLGMSKPFDKYYFRHTLYKICKYVNIDELIKHVSIKST